MTDRFADLIELANEALDVNDYSFAEAILEILREEIELLPPTPNQCTRERGI